MQLKKELGNFNSFQAKVQVALQLPAIWRPQDLDTKAELYSLGESFSKTSFASKESGIEAYMRAVLIDWLIEITSSLACCRQTLHLAVSCADKYIATTEVAQRDFQLVGCACLLIAAKFEEVFTPRVSTVAKAAAYTFTEEQILEMEQRVLLALNWRVLSPTLYAWTRFLMKCWDDYILMVKPPVFMPFHSKDPDSFQLYIDAMSWLDLALMDSNHISFPRSHVAAGAILQAITNSTLALSQVSLLEAYCCFEHFAKAALGVNSLRQIMKVLSMLSEFSDPHVQASIPTPRSKLPLQFEEVLSQQHYSARLLLKYKAKHMRKRLLP